MRTTVCTLAVGDKKIKKCQQLVDTFNAYSRYNVVVYTDQPDAFDSNVNKIDLREFKNIKFRIQSVFNYNLKGVITHHAFNKFDHERIIYLDCDIWLDKPSLALDKLTKADLYASYSKFSEVHRNIQSGQKYERLRQKLGMETDCLTSMLYITETILIINRNKRTNKFISLWNDLCLFSTDNMINPCYEAVELGMALYLAKDVVVENLNGSELKKEGSFMLQNREEVRKLLIK